MWEQIVMNLLSNALKFTFAGGVRVTLRDEGDQVVLEVSDSGIGIADEEISKLFQRFHRSGSVRAHFRGTGMGLTICQTIVQRHGGTIECLPRPVGSGSVFRFDLPAVD